MIKRILSIFKRDMLNSFRDYLILYMFIAPILLAVGFSFFIPSVQSASIQFAVDKSLGEEVIQEFEKYGRVEIYETIEEIENRVNDVDDIAGIVKNNQGEFQVILEGNESHDTEVIPQMIIRDMMRENRADVDWKLSDIGVKRSPIALIGAISIIQMAVLIGGVTIGFNIIEEKESDTIKALNVTPMTKLEFIIGRSIVGIVLPVIHVYIVLWILGMLNVDKIMVLVMTIVSSLIGILIGFLIGIISSNQITGIANMKAVFIVVSLSIIGVLLLPEGKQFLLYWSPPYWSFIGFRDILLNNITWNQLGIYAGWILGLTFIIFLVLRKKIIRGLA